MRTIDGIRTEIEGIKNIKNIDAVVVVTSLMIDCIFERRRLQDQLDREPDNQMQSYLKGKIDILNELTK